jgi:hypothetical protein
MQRDYFEYNLRERGKARSERSKLRDVERGCIMAHTMSSMSDPDYPHRDLTWKEMRVVHKLEFMKKALKIENVSNSK